MATIRDALNSGNVTAESAARQRIKAGDQAATIKATFTGLTSAAAQNITTAAAKAAATVAGVSLRVGENLPPIGQILTLRVTAGAAAAGHRNVTDAGGTAAATLALLSDNGRTLTFEDTVTAFVLTYTPRAAVPMSEPFGFGAPS